MYVRYIGTVNGSPESWLLGRCHITTLTIIIGLFRTYTPLGRQNFSSPLDSKLVLGNNTPLDTFEEAV